MLNVQILCLKYVQKLCGKQNYELIPMRNIGRVGLLRYTSTCERALPISIVLWARHLRCTWEKELLVTIDRFLCYRGIQKRGKGHKEGTHEMVVCCL